MTVRLREVGSEDVSKEVRRTCEQCARALSETRPSAARVGVRSVVTTAGTGSGQITKHEILEICGRCETEQVLLNAGTIGDEWKGFLGTDF
jgi:hypothetical protein